MSYGILLASVYLLGAVGILASGGGGGDDKEIADWVTFTIEQHSFLETDNIYLNLMCA